MDDRLIFRFVMGEIMDDRLIFSNCCIHFQTPVEELNKGKFKIGQGAALARGMNIQRRSPIDNYMFHNLLSTILIDNYKVVDFSATTLVGEFHDHAMNNSCCGR